MAVSKHHTFRPQKTRCSVQARRIRFHWNALWRNLQIGGSITQELQPCDLVWWSLTWPSHLVWPGCSGSWCKTPTLRRSGSVRWSPGGCEPVLELVLLSQLWQSSLSSFYRAGSCGKALATQKGVCNPNSVKSHQQLCTCEDREEKLVQIPLGFSRLNSTDGRWRRR